MAPEYFHFMLLYTFIPPHFRGKYSTFYCTTFILQLKKLVTFIMKISLYKNLLSKKGSVHSGHFRCLSFCQFHQTDISLLNVSCNFISVTASNDPVSNNVWYNVSKKQRWEESPETENRCVYQSVGFSSFHDKLGTSGLSYIYGHEVVIPLAFLNVGGGGKSGSLWLYI